MSNFLELENYLIDGEGGYLFSYSNLPGTITSSVIEDYGNWLSELTRKDVRHRERLACIYCDRKSVLVFPPKPEVEKDRRLAPFSSLEFPQIPPTPVSVAHTHPDWSCFSFGSFFGGDLETVLCQPTRCFHLFTAKNNYLLIKTRETPVITPSIDRSQFFEGFNNNPDVDEIRRFHSYENRCGTGLSPEIFHKYCYEAGIDIGFPASSSIFYPAFCLSFLKSYYIAGRYKLGLYYSEKDGLYRQLTKDVIKNYIAGEIREKIEKVTPKLRRRR